MVLRVSVSKRAISLVEAALESLARPPTTARRAGSRQRRSASLDVLVAGQPAVDRLAEEGEQAVLGVLSGAGVVQAGRRCAGQPEGVVAFAAGEKSGVTGDGGPVELQLDFAVEIDAGGVVLAVTPWVHRSFLAAGVRRKRWISRGKCAIAIPKRPGHLGNPGQRLVGRG